MFAPQRRGGRGLFSSLISRQLANSSALSSELLSMGAVSYYSLTIHPLFFSSIFCTTDHPVFTPRFTPLATQQRRLETFTGDHSWMGRASIGTSRMLTGSSSQRGRYHWVSPPPSLDPLGPPPNPRYSRLFNSNLQIHQSFSYPKLGAICVATSILVYSKSSRPSVAHYPIPRSNIKSRPDSRAKRAWDAGANPNERCMRPPRLSLSVGSVQAR